jgi:hypothetical protein
MKFAPNISPSSPQQNTKKLQKTKQQMNQLAANDTVSGWPASMMAESVVRLLAYTTHNLTMKKDHPRMDSLTVATNTRRIDESFVCT